MEEKLIKMEKWLELPKDIQVYILKKLPATDLAQAAIDNSNPLNSLITSPTFMSQTPSSSSSDTTDFHIYSCSTSDGNLFFFVCHNPFFYDQQLQIITDVPVDVNHSFIGFSSGLVCFANVYNLENLTLVVWNPYLRKSLTIPIPLLYKALHPHALGFAYDVSCLDFKVITIRLLPFQHNSFTADVYTLFGGTRKTLLGSLTRPLSRIRIIEQGIFVNGVMHWLLKFNNNHNPNNSHCCYGYTILAFNLANEMFSEMDFAPCIDHHQNIVLTKFILNGEEKLALYHNDNICDIWVMEEYGVTHSWNKLCTIDCGNEGCGKVLNSWYDGASIMLSMSSGKLELFDQQKQLKRTIKNRDQKNHTIFEYIGPYCTTLVFPKQQPIGQY